MTKTLKTLVLKTVTVAGVKPSTTADRIGLGFVAVAAYPPAEVLSPGHLPLPHDPEPEPTPGVRQELAAMRRNTMQAQASAANPAGNGRAGRPSNPGSSASRRPSSADSRSGGVGTAKWAVAAGRLAVDAGFTGRLRGLPATQGRASDPSAAPSLPGRIGSDCQSPDRRDDRWAASDRRGWRPSGTRVTAPAAAAGK